MSKTQVVETLITNFTLHNKNIDNIIVELEAVKEKLGRKYNRIYTHKEYTDDDVKISVWGERNETETEKLIREDSELRNLHKEYSQINLMMEGLNDQKRLLLAKAQQQGITLEKNIYITSQIVGDKINWFMSNSKNTVTEKIVDNIDIEGGLDSAINILTSFRDNYGKKYLNLFLDYEYIADSKYLCLKGERQETETERRVRSERERLMLSQQYEFAKAKLEFVKSQAAAQNLVLGRDGQFVPAAPK